VANNLGIKLSSFFIFKKKLLFYGINLIYLINNNKNFLHCYIEKFFFRKLFIFLIASVHINLTIKVYNNHVKFSIINFKNIKLKILFLFQIHKKTFNEQR